jgi:hypothetical protein
VRDLHDARLEKLDLVARQGLHHEVHPIGQVAHVGFALADPYFR